MPYRKTAVVAFVLCVLAAILYNSWPLGYVLDAQAAHFGLASDLERVGHPYYAVFIAGDILTSFCVLCAAMLLRFRLWPKFRSKEWAYVYAGMVLFGFFTAISALLPSECTITPVLRCGADGGKGLGLDALASSLAAIGLFVSLIGLSIFNNAKKQYPFLALATRAILVLCLSSTLAFVILALSNGKAHLMQYIFLSAIGLGLFTIGLNIYISVRQSSTEKTTTD